MRRLPILILALLFLAGCRSQRLMTDLPMEREVVNVQKVTEVRWDTVYLQIPAQTAEKVTLDSVSHLETDYATSDARINPDGTLYHSLWNKPQERPQVVPTTIERVDSIVEREVPVPYYIKEPIGSWTKFKSDSFWWLAIGLIAALAWTFRKQLFSFIRK